MKSTEQKATVITVTNQSVILLLGANYIHLNLNKAEESLNMIINGESHKIRFSGSDGHEAISSFWKVLVPNFEMNEYYDEDHYYDDEDCRYCEDGHCNNGC